MLRSSLIAASAVLLCSAASAQQQISAKKALGPVKNAGTYHVATGTWTRGGQTSNISPDRVYRNDAGSGYFGTGWPGCWSVEEMILPGSGNPNGGTQDAYNVDGFDFSYCKNGSGTVDWYFGFWNSYVPCDDPTSPANCIDENGAGILLAGLPGGSACWIVTVDLAGGYEVCYEADGGSCAPGYDGGGLDLDSGAYGFGWDASDGGLTGPFLNGDPSWKPAGDGTCYTPGFNNVCGATDATGLGAQDLFSITNYDHAGSGFDASGCGLGNGCYFFGGYSNINGCGAASNTPFASFGMNLFADCNDGAQDCPDGGVTIYCDESQNPNNVADIGVSSASLGAGINVTMSNAPSGQFTYLLTSQGTGVVNSPPGSKGSLCIVGGCIGRYAMDVGTIDGAGNFSTDIENSVSGGANYGIPTCGGNFASGQTWNFQYWHRQPMGQPSTFSSAAAVTFTN